MKVCWSSPERIGGDTSPNRPGIVLINLFNGRVWRRVRACPGKRIVPGFPGFPGRPQWILSASPQSETQSVGGVAVVDIRQGRIVASRRRSRAARFAQSDGDTGLVHLGWRPYFMNSVWTD